MLVVAASSGLAQRYAPALGPISPFSQPPSTTSSVVFAAWLRKSTRVEGPSATTAPPSISNCTNPAPELSTMSPRCSLTPSAPHQTAAPRITRRLPSRSVTVPISCPTAGSGSNRNRASTRSMDFCEGQSMALAPNTVVGRRGRKLRARGGAIAPVRPPAAASGNAGRCAADRR